VSDSIHLHDHLLAGARRLLDVGHDREARQALRRLLRQPEVQTQVRADAHCLLGELDSVAGRYRSARRHFAAAIGLRPYLPEAYVRFAEAVEADPDADLRKGCAALRRAICIDPHDAAYPAALGRLAARLGDWKLARRAFRRAARLRPESLTVLAEVVAGFVSIGQEAEARQVILAALFRAPRDAGVIDLWNRFRFDRLRRELARSGGVVRQSILPFPESMNAAVAGGVGAAVIRVDRHSRPAPHVLRLFGRSRPTR
jgi:tetratricopeptide (TPR) repeat protein